MDFPYIIARTKKRFIDIPAILNSATPRVELFMVANFLKLGASIAVGLASFLHLNPLSSFAGVVLFVWFGIMLSVAASQVDFFLVRFQQWLTPAWRISVVLLAIVLSVEIVAVGTVLVWDAADRASMPDGARAIRYAFTLSDATALTEQATENLLSGRNPYASSNIITALNSSLEAYNKLTPLRAGAFASAFPYPTEEQLRVVWEEAIKHPEIIPVEVESKFNYPAGSFLLPAPFMALGVTDLRVVMLIFTIPALIYAAWIMAYRQRWYFALGTVLSIELWNAIYAGDISLLYLPFVLMGWLLLPRNIWLSAFFMGVAMATKQTAWFLLPFYLILSWKTRGFWKASIGGMVIGFVFFSANAPFLAADPALWFSSIMAPITDKMFPLGAGIISFVTGGVIRIESSLPFTVLEIIVLAGGILWYMRYARRYPHTGLFLAILPLFFAWRSMWDYFYYADIILLAAILTSGNTFSPKKPLSEFPVGN